MNRHVVKEVVAACAHQPDVWRDLGIELLGQDGISQLDVIKVNNGNDVTKCCSEMLALWRQRQPSASWNQLIEALKQVKLNKIATGIEKLLVPSGEQQDKMKANKGTSSKSCTDLPCVYKSRPFIAQTLVVENIGGSILPNILTEKIC